MILKRADLDPSLSSSPDFSRPFHPVCDKGKETRSIVLLLSLFFFFFVLLVYRRMINEIEERKIWMDGRMDGWIRCIIELGC